MSVMGFEMRIDDWHKSYGCKKVPLSAFKSVFKVIGAPMAETWDSEDYRTRFFTELRNQRPDLFEHGSRRSHGGRKSQSQGCLVLVVLVIALSCAVVRMAVHL